VAAHSLRPGFPRSHLCHRGGRC